MMTYSIQLDMESVEKWGKPYKEVQNTDAVCRFCKKGWYSHSEASCATGDKYAYDNWVAAGKPGSRGASVKAEYVEY